MRFTDYIYIEVKKEARTDNFWRVNPLATRDLAEKHVVKLVEGFFGHCRAV